MLEHPRDYLRKKARDLGLDREDLIRAAQDYLDGRWPGQARVRSYNENMLRIITPNAPLASEIRMRQLEILAALRRHDPAVKSVVVSIG